MNGTVNVNQAGGYPGGQAAYSANGYIGSAGFGPGGGLPATPGTNYSGVGGGGGGFGGPGGRGGSSNQTSYPAGLGGTAAGNLLLTLEGGSGGGGGQYSNNSSNTGGTGGGALELGAIDTITMAGQITANGNPGGYNSGGAGSDSRGG